MTTCPHLIGRQGPGCRDCIPLPGCQHGACTKSFTCQCEAGWGGMFCNQPECEDSCAARRGVCVAPGQCECQPGYRGEECGECAPPPGCSHGTCSEPLECACEEGWRGELCDQAVCAETCSAEHGSCTVPGECACQLGWTGPSCDTCMPYPGCVNGACHGEPYTCDCEPGWTGPLCDTPETAVYGAGEREGRCQPLGAFLCFHGGEDVCVYTGAGARVGPPVCRCPPGYWGTWCQDRGNGARVGDTGVAALRPGDLLTVEGVEPRHGHAQTDTSEEAEEDIQEIERRIHEVHGSLSETMGVRAIHSDVFNSGKLIEHMGAREGLE